MCLTNIMNNVIFFEENLAFFKKYDFGPALFLDRDGVLIKDLHYLSDPDNVFLENGVTELLEKAFISKWKVIVVTNQSGISRGYLTWSDYDKVTSKMIKLLGIPNKISAIYANSIVSDKENKTWRKPSPAMLLQASKDLKIDLKKSILIGDRFSDLLAGFRAGLKNVYHVSTGHGKDEISKVKSFFNSENKIKLNFNSTELFYIKSLVDFDKTIFQNPDF